MKLRISSLIAMLVMCHALGAEGVSNPSSGWSLSATPSFALPLVNGSFGANDLFASAWGGCVGAERAFAGKPLALRLGIGYAGGGFLDAEDVAVSGSMSELSLTGGLKAAKELSPRVSLAAFLDAGLGYGSLSTGTSAPYAVGR